MADTLPFAIDIVRILWARLSQRATDLQYLVEAAVPFEGWLETEAFLACREQQSERGFCEVALRPTYGSENVTTDNGQPSVEHGTLRVGGSGEPGDHRWLFAEVVLLLDGERADWTTRTEAAIARLLRLGWKRSASVLILVAVGNEDLARLAAWNRPSLTDGLNLSLRGGGTLRARAFDVKRNPADTLASTLHSTSPA